MNEFFKHPVGIVILYAFQAALFGVVMSLYHIIYEDGIGARQTSDYLFFVGICSWLGMILGGIHIAVFGVNKNDL